MPNPGIRLQPRDLLTLALVALLALLVVIASADHIGVVSYLASGTHYQIRHGVTFNGPQPISSCPGATNCRRPIGGQASISPAALWLGLSLGFALIVGTIALLVASRRSQSPSDEESEPAETHALQATTRRQPSNPREAVLAAFGDLEDRLAASGAGRLPAEGPDGYLRRALPAPWRTSSAKSTLLRWYTVARYSDQPIDPESAARAVTAAAELSKDISDSGASTSLP